MKKLDHKYIMKLEEIHESKNSIYLVLELLQGGELLNYISSKQQLSLKDYWRVMKCILEALAYMDSKKIMHRDLKPDNMILKFKDKLENSVLKIVDYGLATVYDIPEYLFKRCGTPGFVAPEVINAPSKVNIHYTPKCDVFSAGVIFYILLTEKSPFDGKSFREILQKNKDCQINFNHPKIRKFPMAQDLLVKLLETDPNRRISAKEALSHPFLSSFADQDVIIDQSIAEPQERFQDYRNQQQVMANNQRQGATNGMSLIIRNNPINGNTDTIQNSFNSQGNIQSFKSMSNPNEQKKSSMAQRESILKFVLMQNTNEQSDSIYTGNRFFQETFESEEEEEYEF